MFPLHTLRSTLGRQTATFFSAQALNAALGLVIAYVLTAALNTDEYGQYLFLVSVFTITMVFFDFGLNPAVKRLIAMAGDDEEPTLFGAAIVYSLVMGLMLAATLALLSLWIEALFPKSSGSGSMLLFMAPFALLYPLYELVLSVTQGRNSIRTLSVATVLPRVLFIFGIAAIGALADYGVLAALILFLITFGLTAVGIAGVLRPRFTDVATVSRRIMSEIREFGFDIYYGRIIDGITYGFDKILLTRFHGLSPTGIYGLGLALVLPVSMFSRAVAASAYKRFIVEPYISQKTLYFNMGGCILSGVVLVAGCFHFVPMIFPDNYTDSLAVIPYLAVGSALAGLNAPYHAFLAAKRQGKSLRTMSFITSGLNIGLNVALIPFFAMMGAAVAYIATYAVNLVLNLYYYRQYLEKNHENGEYA